MKSNRLLGIVLLAAGVACALYGYNRSNTFVSQLGGALGQTDSTALGAMIIGAIVALGGVLLIARD